jgi:DNA invertase Pin-like site-specific DNA recombinase
MANAGRRCAIYTRKSSEEGLEQDYNSLHAQRESCEAFIRSQAGEGWRLIKTAYDDGGFSGAGMERPGLQQLLSDIRAGLVDTVVVYKVDRLTRSLTDFARMVELFDARYLRALSRTRQRAAVSQRTQPARDRFQRQGNKEWQHSGWQAIFTRGALPPALQSALSG